MTAKITHDGTEYEFRGEYRKVKEGDRFLARRNGGVMTAGKGSVGDRVRAIVHPMPVTHTFGGVVFEETDYRIPCAGEWMLSANEPLFRVNERRADITAYPILRPVSVEGEGS